MLVTASSPAFQLNAPLTATPLAPAAGSRRLSPVGGEWSTLNVAAAGVGSGGSGPEPSSGAPFSQTLNVCEPSGTSERTTGLVQSVAAWSSSVHLRCGG